MLLLRGVMPQVHYVGYRGGAEVSPRMPLIAGRCNLWITAQREPGRRPSSRAAAGRAVR